MSSWFITFLWTCLCIIAICILFTLVRLIKGPSISDRIVSVNMIGTMANAIIIILSILLKEGWLLDVAILYAMLSFLAVVVLTKVYMGVYKENKLKNKDSVKEEK